MFMNLSRICQSTTVGGTELIIFRSTEKVSGDRLTLIDDLGVVLLSLYFDLFELFFLLVNCSVDASLASVLVGLR
jgi:hypothetical protein